LLSESWSPPLFWGMLEDLEVVLVLVVVLAGVVVEVVGVDCAGVDAGVEVVGELEPHPATTNATNTSAPPASRRIDPEIGVLIAWLQFCRCRDRLCYSLP